MASKTEIEQTKNQFQLELKENFDEAKFDNDVASGKSISSQDLERYKKFLYSNFGGLSFISNLKDGVYTAIGSNSHIIKSRNLNDLNRKLAKVFKLYALENDGEPWCQFTLGKNSPNAEAEKEAFARNFVNEGVVIKGDFPKSKTFWQNFKKEYLSKNHNLRDWNRLTRFVPNEYTQNKISLFKKFAQHSR